MKAKCKNGHTLTPVNTYTCKRNMTSCMQCKAAWQKAFNKKKKQQGYKQVLVWVKCDDKKVA